MSVMNYSTTDFKLYEEENITIGQIELELKKRRKCDVRPL